MFRRLTFERSLGLVQSEALLTTEEPKNSPDENERRKNELSSKSKKKGRRKTDSRTSNNGNFGFLSKSTWIKFQLFKAYSNVKEMLHLRILFFLYKLRSDSLSPCLENSLFRRTEPYAGFKKNNEEPSNFFLQKKKRVDVRSILVGGLYLVKF